MRVAAVDLGKLGFQRREAGEHRLHRRVLLGVEPGQLLGDLRERSLARRLERREPGGEAVERALRIAARELGEFRLQRREAGEHRLHRRILLGVEPGQLLGDLRERGFARRLERREPVAERGPDRVQRLDPRLEPFGEALDLRLRVARGEPGLERADPAGELFGQRLLLGVQPGELLAERAHRAAADLGPEAGDLGPHSALLGLQRLDPLQRLAPGVARRRALGLQRVARRRALGLQHIARRRALGLERPELGLDRPEPGEHRLDPGVPALLQPRQPVGQLLRGAARGGEGRELRLEPRAAGGLRGLQFVEATLQSLEQRPRLGRRAHLLERAHPGAQLVEPGERGLERRVLVAHEAEQLARHRLQPLLGRGPLGCERVEPQRQIRLRRGQRLQPVGVGARARDRIRLRRALPRRPLPPPLGERQPESAEGGDARRPQSRDADSVGLHAPSARYLEKYRPSRTVNRLGSG